MAFRYSLRLQFGYACRTRHLWWNTERVSDPFLSEWFISGRFVEEAARFEYRFELAGEEVGPWLPLREITCFNLQRFWGIGEEWWRFRVKIPEEVCYRWKEKWKSEEEVWKKNWTGANLHCSIMYLYFEKWTLVSLIDSVFWIFCCRFCFFQFSSAVVFKFCYAALFCNAL